MKRTFLLLEVLIALLLVSLCIVPLVRQPLRMYKNELAKLEILEKERLADWVYSEVKENLIKNKIPWAKIPKKNQTTGPFPLPSVKLHLPGCREKTIPCQFTLLGKGDKKGPQGEDFRLVYMSLFLDEQKYVYRIPIQRINSK
jgi:hypothetical protein